MRLAPAAAGARRAPLLAALGTIDESTAMAVAQPTPRCRRVAFWWTFGGVYVFWNIATLLGALARMRSATRDRFGLDAVIPAAFLALLAPRLRAGAVERRVAHRRCGDRAGADPVRPAGRAGARVVRRAAVSAGRVAPPMSLWVLVDRHHRRLLPLKLAGYLVPAAAAGAPQVRRAGRAAAGRPAGRAGGRRGRRGRTATALRRAAAGRVRRRRGRGVAPGAVPGRGRRRCGRRRAAAPRIAGKTPLPGQNRQFTARIST